MPSALHPRLAGLAPALLLAACGGGEPDPESGPGAGSDTRVVLEQVALRLLEDFEVEVEAAGEVGPRELEIAPPINSTRTLFQGFAIRAALAVPPGDRATYQVEVPPNAALEFGVAMDRSAAETGSDGMGFELLVDGESVWDAFLRPTPRPNLRAWAEHSISLEEYAGRTIRVTLATHPGPSGDATGDLGGFSDVLVKQRSWFPRQRSGPDRPNLLLVLVDTLRADALAGPGAALGPLTPHVDRLADEGLVFERAYSSAPWTMPSVASIFTGLHVQAHGTVGLFQPRLLDEHETLAESLTRMGAMTHAFVANALISKTQNYDQGFQGFESFPRTAGRRDDCAVLFDAATEWILEAGDTQWFAYIHALDPHDPYDPPPDLLELMVEPYSGPYPDANTKVLKALRDKIMAGEDPGVSERDVRYFKELYAAEVTAFDRALGRLMERLEERGALENTLVVLTSDHGEEFYEHGSFLHGHDTHEELVHVPLVFWWPGALAAGRCSTPVSLVDLRSTLCRALAPQGEGAEAGPSLFEIAAGAPGSALLFSTQGGTDGRNQIAGIVDGRWKVKQWTDAGVFEVYDLSADPGEASELLAGRAPEDLPDGDPLARAVKEFTRLYSQVPRPSRGVRAEADPAALEALRALGYVD